MAFKSYRKESHADWGINTNGPLNIEQIRTGALLRIADATEAMAKYHVQIIKDRDLYARWHKEKCEQVSRLEKSNASLRGVITRMKNKAKG